MKKQPSEFPAEAVTDVELIEKLFKQATRPFATVANMHSWWKTRHYLTKGQYQHLCVLANKSIATLEKKQ